MHTRFITSIFGDKHFGMLPCLLFSIKKTNPQSGVTVFWEDIPDEKISVIQKSFPEFEFIPTHFNFTNDPEKRISSKTFMWEHAAQMKHDDTLIFLDVDTLVIKNIRPFIKNKDFDVLFTTKNESFPLNTGVIVCRGNERVRTFFSLWKQNTLEIINNPKLFAMANDYTLPYGGADQMALHTMLKYKPTQSNYVLYIKNNVVHFVSAPCSILNETNSTKITPNTHIIHYKGGWQPVLLKGRHFNRRRKKKDSMEMYIHYLQNYKETMLHINQMTRDTYTTAFFGIHIPLYINTDTWKENKFLFLLYFLQNYPPTVFDRARDILRKLLTH